MSMYGVVQQHRAVNIRFNQDNMRWEVVYGDGTFHPQLIQDFPTIEVALATIDRYFRRNDYDGQIE